MINSILINVLKDNLMRRGHGEIIAIALVIVIALLVLLGWFFCCCYNWLVIAFPTFVAFPKWAFVLLMFLLGSGGGSHIHSKD